jgi:transcriptional regulator with GAF, ATPase, and Fis domain
LVLVLDAIAAAQSEGLPQTLEFYLPQTQRWWRLQLFPAADGESIGVSQPTPVPPDLPGADSAPAPSSRSPSSYGIIGRGMAAVLQQVALVGPSNASVLITGETGTGKELVARAVHAASARRERALVKVNCAAISAGLIESELFGHEKGAFTGAMGRRVGRFELAHGGTLFLDEVAELARESQAKLLRVLQEGELERVGSSFPIKVDVRVVAATNRDLNAEVRAGRFRADLLFRLNVFPIDLPPLRARRDDIPELAEVFVRQEAAKLQRSGLTISPPALNWLSGADWRGNVRELQNIIARACIVARGPEVTLADLVAFAGPGADATLDGLDRPLKALEREAVISAIEASAWVLDGPRGAAARLGLHPNTLRSRLKKLQITRPRKPG